MPLVIDRRRIVARRLIPSTSTLVRALGLLALGGALAVPGVVRAQQRSAPATVAAAPPTTVILVRHAERAGDPSGDPALTAAGETRAKALVPVLRDAGVNAIITTQYQRTRLTAQPTAEALGITPEVVAASGQDHPAAVARYIREKHAGHTVLVVGHSNTINAIAAALGAAHPGLIDDATYDNLYIVTVGPEKSTIVKAKY